MNKIENLSGFALSLASLRTEESPVIGEYTALVKAGEFAKKCGFSIIQLLPVLDTGTQSSPYSSLSAFALHPIYINLSHLHGFDYCIKNDKSFKKEYDEFLKHKNDLRFDYNFVLNAKERLIRKIWDMISHSTAFLSESEQEKIGEMESWLMDFIEANPWLKAYCVFKVLKYKYMQASSKTWPLQDRNLSKEEIEARWNDRALLEQHYFYAFEQLVAFRQFKAASDEIKKMGIILKGDIPILLNDDSCDVWSTPEIFKQELRAGSPPDGDNPSGQNWGFPIYDWKAQEKDGFSWWKLRLKECQKFFGAYRLDHIPGFFRLWAIPEGEKTAELGRTEPCATISYSSLLEAHFSADRIKWLSQPHIPTEDIFRLTGDLEKSHDILSLFCTRIGFEELWNFKPSFKSARDIEKADLSKFELDAEMQNDVKIIMLHWWKNRTLISVGKKKFVPYYKYGETKAWNSLNNDEKKILSEFFSAIWKKQESLWKKQAEKIFSALIPSTDMVPCGEDLGVMIGCMPKVMKKFQILSLKVIRWCRNWSAEGQPFDDMKKYNKLSLVTTSVHDCSTLRQWWNSEKNSAKAFEQAFLSEKKKSKNKEVEPFFEDSESIFKDDFSPEIARKVLSVCAKTNGAWFVNPIQDWLYLDDANKSPCWSENSDNERMNIPGTVSEFNWTYRIPLTFEELMKKESMISKIKKIIAIHG